MIKYDPKEFANRLTERCAAHPLRPCPFCGHQDYTSTEDFATILISNDHLNLSLGPNIPAGMVICKNCGHMDFFALGALDLLPKKEAENGK